MDILIKLNSQVAGKDKIARLIQYSCRACWDSLNQKDEAQLVFIHQLKNLEYILSSFRKLLRFGKSFEIFYSSLKSIHYSDAWIAFTLTVTKICQGIFLLTDHLIWLSRSGLFKNIDTAKWSHRSNRYWLVSIVMSIVRDVYEINRIIISFTSYKSITSCITSSLISVRSTKDIKRCAASFAEFLMTYKHVSIDTIKNICDLFIPLNGLGYIKMTPRVIGILGVISSLMGLIVVLDPSCKLLPQ